jgi:alpha-D-ribose 1-methylphosphonate 5-triphosphate synthase subunit PhnH
MMQAGFADPVSDAQACFRAVLDAMARPGRIHRAAAPEPPPPLAPATAAVLLTLVDGETPLWLDDSADAARNWVAFHCGAQVVADPNACAFGMALRMPALDLLPAGTHEAPETAATLILQLPALGTGPRYRLSGPGLRDSQVLQAEGLPADFTAAWQRNRALFPRGIDLILCAGAQLTALPRTVSVTEA